jgi:TPR repeat protein
MDARNWKDSESGIQFFALVHGRRKFTRELYRDTDTHELAQCVLGSTVRPNSANYWHPRGEQITWYQSAADQGDALAQIKLAEALLSSRLTDDFEEAVLLLRKAADQGYHEAQFSLGNIYATGHPWGGFTGDFEIDKVESISWYRKAAEGRLVGAIMSLGDCYADPYSGVKEDLSLAARWYHKAALLGNHYAQRKMAQNYAQGIGVELNNVEAFAYWNVALATIENRLALDYEQFAIEGMEEIEDLEVKLSRDEITAGMNRVREIQDEISRTIAQG